MRARPGAAWRVHRQLQLQLPNQRPLHHFPV
jgi:hypothetical protein